MNKRYLIILLGLLLTNSYTAFSQSVGGFVSGVVSFCDTVNGGFISLGGYNGTILDWQTSTDGGQTWVSTGNTVSPLSYSNIKKTTCYRAIVQDGVFPPDTSSQGCITLYSPTVAGSISGAGSFCGSAGPGTLVLNNNNGNVLYWLFSSDGGQTYTQIPQTSTTLNYPQLNQSTLVKAVVQNTSFCAIDTSQSVELKIIPLTIPGTLTLQGNDSVCFAIGSDTINLSGNLGKVVNWISSTDSGATWTDITLTDSAYVFSGLSANSWYAAIIQNETCNLDTTNWIYIKLYPKPSVNAGLDTAILLSKTVNLTGSGSGTPFWIPATGLSDQTIFNPSAAPVVTTNYVLTVTDTNGCINADTVKITVIQPEFKGAISNIFSPNGDGVNDFWFIEDALLYPDNEVTVYNIYGKEVFSKKGYTNDWNGTFKGSKLPDGTYYYVVKMDNTGKILKGSIDIIHN